MNVHGFIVQRNAVLVSLQYEQILKRKKKSMKWHERNLMRINASKI